LPSLLQSPEFVRLALAGVEQEIEQTRERLAKLQAYASQLRAGARVTPAAVPAAAAATPAKGRKAGRGANRLSPEARQALSERMRRKWAEFRKAKAEAQAPGKGKASRKAAKAAPSS
jgi:hypothetical protein